MVRETPEWDLLKKQEQALNLSKSVCKQIAVKGVS